MQYFVAGALFVINLVAFALMGIDKRRAIKDRWRIPEKVLFLWAFIGGAWGAWAGMKAFRHKTRKPIFRFGIPALCVLETALLIVVLYKLLCR